ncbi:MAG: alcohol dehydrogenase catalytic domain-containing protein, partial [Bryobacteraceae bacterium]|nr:alcohol dehydrogenase catalytic domain-containing protein [Bryobacteraceae bacterium]
MKAAIFHGPHQPLTIEQVEIDTPMAREVLVRTVASGVCHSDLHFVDGLYPFPAPAILGHEAAGIVEAVGDQVTTFKPGDHVIACLSVFCGECDYCLTGRTHLCSTRPMRAKTDPPKLTWNGQPVNQFANLSSYAEKMLVHEHALVKIDDDMPLDRAALIGCGVTTGWGSSVYAAGVQASESPYYYFFNWMNIFFKFGTPCFIFLSSFVLFYNYAGRPVNRGLIFGFYRKRLLYIVMPYLVASVCYYFVNQGFNGDLSLPVGTHLAKLAAGVATGTAYTHLYFVFINVQFYLLFPLVLLLLKRFPGLAPWAVPLGLAIEWGFALWNKYDLQLEDKASYAPTYMSYYMLGLCAAAYFDRLKPWLARG